MRFGVVIPQLTSDEEPLQWPDLVRFARRAEDAGIDSLWAVDHLGSRGEVTTPGIFECWSVLSALAEATKLVELGPLVSCVSFRNPALLAKMATTVDEISGGRLTLGVGAGSFEQEHLAYGYPADALVSRFEEAIQIVQPLLRGETVTTSGRFHASTGAVLLPPPSRSIPLLVGTRGYRMLRLAARYADAWNAAWFGRPGVTLRALMQVCDRALADEDRDPTTFRRTIGIGVHVEAAGSGTRAPDESSVVAKSPHELAEVLDEYRELGIDDVIIGLRRKSLDGLDFVASSIAILKS